jgi:hypothetical protein
MLLSSLAHVEYGALSYSKYFIYFSIGILLLNVVKQMLCWNLDIMNNIPILFP